MENRCIIMCLSLTRGHVFLSYFSFLPPYHSDSKRRHIQGDKEIVHTCTLFVPILETNTALQTQPLDHTQLSVFDSVSIRGAQGPLLLPLQSSTVLLLHLLRRLLLVASLSLAPALSFAERQWQAATQLVSDGTGYNVMPLWLVVVQKSETRSELLAVFPAVCGVSC